MTLTTGCDDQGNFEFPSFGDSAEADSTQTATLAADTGTGADVEAPDVFKVEEAGLWDGRPSLGGVWVAHPTVTDPERVIIKNPATGESAIGALFRRERENPGPALQVSSDAAEAVGMLPGAPTQLEVVALRREEGPAIPDVDAIMSAETDILDGPTAITATPLDGSPEDSFVVAAPAGTAPSSAEVLAAITSPTDGSPPPLIPVPTAVTPETLAAPAPAPQPASTLDKPFIQIGIFSVEANANRTADTLRADGLSSRVLAQESQGKNFWRVIVGPAPSATDRDAVLGKVKSLGFSDAYFVSN